MVITNQSTVTDNSTNPPTVVISNPVTTEVAAPVPPRMRVINYYREDCCCNAYGNRGGGYGRSCRNRCCNERQNACCVFDGLCCCLQNALNALCRLFCG